MDINKAKLILSRERMHTYAKMAQQYDKGPVDMYLLNIQLSGAFHLPLHMCEVMLRNTLDRAISGIFTNDWHINPQFQRLIDRYQRGKLIESVNKNTGKHTGLVPKGKVIAELTLGFWVNLLSPKYAHIWVHHFYNCFSHYKAIHPLSNNPTNVQNALYNQLKILNKFRNCIAHYEPIIKHNLLAEYARILNIISYIDTDCAKWVQSKQRIKYYLKQLKNK